MDGQAHGTKDSGADERTGSTITAFPLTSTSANLGPAWR